MQRKNPVTSRFVATLEFSGNRLWGCHFRVPGDIAERHIRAGSHRVRCRLEETLEYPCALLHAGDGGYLITVNKTIRGRLGRDIGEEVHVALHTDTSRYGLPMPEELRELLRQDPAGSKAFHALTPGKQRTLLYIVGNVKSMDKRIGRALAVVNHLKKNGGKIDYRGLNEELKSARWR
jgi:hypothetical protein